VERDPFIVALAPDLDRLSQALLAPSSGADEALRKLLKRRKSEPHANQVGKNGWPLQGIPRAYGGRKISAAKSVATDVTHFSVYFAISVRSAMMRFGLSSGPQKPLRCTNDRTRTPSGGRCEA
jgi:hypothetical protein